MDQLGKLTMKFNYSLSENLFPPVDQLDSSVFNLTIMPKTIDEKHKFSWFVSMIDFDDNIIVFQLYFEDPLYITAED